MQHRRQYLNSARVLKSENAMSERTDEAIQLSVKHSAVHGRGVARIHEKHLEALGIENGDNIVVGSPTSVDDGPILIKIFADMYIGENDIRLRKSDRERLGVKKNDMVALRPYEKRSEEKKRRFFGLFSRG